jgi:hypothetical protein
VDAEELAIAYLHYFESKREEDRRAWSDAARVANLRAHGRSWREVTEEQDRTKREFLSEWVRTVKLTALGVVPFHFRRAICPASQKKQLADFKENPFGPCPSAIRRSGLGGRNLVLEVVRVEAVKPAFGSFRLRIHEETHRRAIRSG